MKKILFPTDFSKSAENAFLYALSLAGKINAEIILYHVYELPELGRSLKTTTKEVYELMEMETLESFKSSVKELRELAGKCGFENIPLTHEMQEGEVISRVCKKAQNEKADYIVMGTQGATGLKEVFLGSIATGVIDESPIPVISVPEQANYTNPISTIAYLSNYKPEEMDAFKQVYDFASSLSASVMCVHYDGEEENENGDREKWKAGLVEELKGVSYNVIVGENFEKALVAFSQEHKIDLLAVLPRKRNIFQRIFSKSVSKTIAHHLHVPLFSLPKK